jgi:hypothetical protein
VALRSPASAGFRRGRSVGILNAWQSHTATPFVIDIRKREVAMYFGTLVAQARDEQEKATWQRDMDAARVVTPRRWRAFWRGLARLFA